MERYICTICGHTYNPDKGESLQNIPPGIDFTALPENWECPICCASKKNFEKE